MVVSKKKSNKKPAKKPTSPPFWEIVSIPRPSALPKDFASTPKEKQEVKTYKDYFDVTIDNLSPSSSNKVVFSWKFTDGTIGPPSTAYTLVTSADTPLQPTGFEVKRALGGVVVSWNGSYSSGTFFSEFKAIKIYAGTSATATTGTYAYVGQLTADRTNNSLFIPVDKTDTYPNGQYVRYGEYVYIHASSINQGNIESAIAANVASVSNGAGRATDADINDGAVVIEKLAANVLTVDNIKAGTINSTSYIRAGTKNLINGSGARIEIASNTVEDGTYDVLPGITVYNTGGSPIFRADLVGNVSIGGYTPTDISNISSTASSASSIASTANSRAQKFDTSGNINAGIVMNATGSIYSSKTSYTDTTTGWYIGWYNSNPVINIGSSTNYVRWTGSQLQIKGPLEVTGTGKIGPLSIDGTLPWLYPSSSTDDIRVVNYDQTIGIQLRATNTFVLWGSDVRLNQSNSPTRHGLRNITLQTSTTMPTTYQTQYDSINSPLLVKNYVDGDIVFVHEA